MDTHAQHSREGPLMREVIVMVRDDLDHSLDADIEVRLGVDGLVYCLDLTTEHAERSRAELAAWLSASHEVVKDKRRPRDKSTVADRLGSKSGSAPKPAPTPRVSPSSAASAPDHRAGSSPAATGMRCG